MKYSRPALAALTTAVAGLGACTTSYTDADDLSKISPQSSRALRERSTEISPSLPSLSLPTPAPYTGLLEVTERYSGISPANFNLYVINGQGHITPSKFDTRGRLDRQRSDLLKLESICNQNHVTTFELGDPTANLDSRSQQNQMNNLTGLANIFTIGSEYNHDFSIKCEEKTTVENGQNTSTYRMTVDFNPQSFEMQKDRKDLVFLLEFAENTATGFGLSTIIAGPKAGVLGAGFAAASTAADGVIAYIRGQKTPDIDLRQYQVPSGEHNGVFNTHELVRQLGDAKSVIALNYGGFNDSGIIGVNDAVTDVTSSGNGSASFTVTREYGDHLQNWIASALRMAPANLLLLHKDGSTTTIPGGNPGPGPGPGPSGGVSGGQIGGPGGR